VRPIPARKYPLRRAAVDCAQIARPRAIKTALKALRISVLCVSAAAAKATTQGLRRVRQGSRPATCRRRARATSMSGGEPSPRRASLRCWHPSQPACRELRSSPPDVARVMVARVQPFRRRLQSRSKTAETVNDCKRWLSWPLNDVARVREHYSFKFPDDARAEIVQRFSAFWRAFMSRGRSLLAASSRRSSINR
jgi:hypothetical protein